VLLLLSDRLNHTVGVVHWIILPSWIIRHYMTGVSEMSIALL
jgi:hypothetical protein